MALTLQFKHSCEALSIAWRQKIGNKHAFDPLPAAELLTALEVLTVTPDHFQQVPEVQRGHLNTVQDWSAMIVALDPITVLYNPTQSPARYESTMMHECAHILLEHPMVQYKLWGQNSRYEDEAVYCGGCLQIPRRGLQWAVQKHMSAEEIGRHFGSSVAMVNYRANMTGMRKDIREL